MRLPLLLKVALRNVFRNRRRSLYALATIAVGAMGILVFMGFNTGLMEQYKANTIRARWGHGQIFHREYRGIAHANPWEKWINNPSEVIKTLQGAHEVYDFFPRVNINAMLSFDRKTISGQGEGINGVAESRFFTEMNYVEGSDFKDHPSGIVLGEGLAKGLAAHVGDELVLSVRDIQSAIRSEKFSVTGVFHTGSNEFDSRAFRIPLTQAQTLLGTERVEAIAVGLKDDSAWGAFSKKVEKAFPDLEAIPFHDLDKIYYQHAVDWLNAQFSFIRSIILLVVFLSIFNVISMSIMERTAEIGTLRAHGKTRSEIALGVLLESAILGILGGTLGIIVGWLLTIGPLSSGVDMPPAPGITRSFRIFIQLGGHNALQVLWLSSVTALAGGLLPIWRGTRIPIAEALRHV